MPTPLEVVRPHDMRCRLCVEYDDHGNEVPTSGHYLCQATGCDELAEFTWPRRIANNETTEPVLACGDHTLPVGVRDRAHDPECPAPDPGCSCSWE